MIRKPLFFNDLNEGEHCLKPNNPNLEPGRHGENLEKFTNLTPRKAVTPRFSKIFQATQNHGA
jgi:hypothetical protein